MKKIIKIILVLLILAGLAGWFFGKSIAEDQVKAFLAKKEVPVESLSVSAIWFDSVTLDNVKMGKDGNVEIDSATLIRTGDKEYPYAMDASGLKLKVRADGNLVDLGGVEKLWQKEAFPSKPAKPISIAIETDADLKSDGGKKVQGIIDLAKLTISQKGTETHVKDADIEIKTFAGPVYKAPFTIDELTIAQQGTNVVAPLKLKGEAQYTLQSSLANIVANINALSDDMKADVKAVYNVKGEAGTINVVTPTLDLGEGKLELAKLLPSAAKDTPTPDMVLALNSVITLAKGDWTKMDVNAKFDKAPVAKLLEKALGKGAKLDGQIQGVVPITLSKAGTKTNWRINNARVQNNGAMKLTMLGDAAGVVGNLLDMLGKKGGETARALQEVNVSQLDLTGNSTDDKGNMTLKGTVAGNNPVIGRGVQLNLNLTTNLRDLLRSMAGDATSYVKGNV